MVELFRTFIALKVEPGPAFIESIKTMKSELSGEPAVRWVGVNKLHLTLKFIGDTSAFQVNEIKKVLGEMAMQYPPFTFRLEGLGFFKNKGLPRVLFANIHEKGVLEQLAVEMETRLTELGFEPERRPFKPHLTLARIKFLKNRDAFFRVVESNKNRVQQEVRINEIIFFQSILKPSGPVYRALEVFDLG